VTAALPPDGRPTYIEQNITAVDGFAYGVIGTADIHIFGDGVPVYVLEQHRPARPPDPEWLREMPSRMLNARHEVVAFTGRDAELADLHVWRQDGPRLAVRWLHGGGGQGKTRLAAQFADECTAVGWKVVAATHGPGTVLASERPSQDLRLDEAAGLLLIVDYADRWPLTHLTWLLSNRLLHQVGVPTRVLMLARTEDAWPTVRAVLANHQAGTSGQRLEPLGTALNEREDMFTAARDSFATHYHIDDADAIGPPAPLDEPDMGLTLAVHIAALVAVDAYVGGRRPPRGMAALTIYLLDREHLQWARLFGDGSHELDPTDRTFTTPPAVINRIVFAAALTGALDWNVGTALIRRLDLGGDPDRILTDHRTCYPPADRHRPTALEPLYPDRLAEDFLALSLPGHRVEYPAQDWAPGIATTVLAAETANAADGARHSPAWTPRAITFLAASAERWPHVGAAHLYPLIRDAPQLLIDAGSAAITALTGIDGLELDVLEAVEPLLPDQAHVDLDIGAAAISDRLTPYRLANATDPADRARLYYNHANCLGNAGRRQESLAADQQAADIFRALAVADPDAYQPELAASLNNLGTALADLARWEEALPAAEDAVTIRRRLAGIDPTYLPDLAMSLGNVGRCLSRMGRQEPALTPITEGTDILRRLAVEDPTAHLPNLARSLTNLAAALAELGRGEQALTPIEEAIAIRRALADADPAAYLPELAGSLNNLGAILQRLQRYEEGQAQLEEAVAIRRRLAEVNPAVYLPDVVTSLINLGVGLAELRNWEASLPPTAEAVDIGRRLAVADPGASPALATALANLGTVLRGLRKPDEGAVRWEEELAIRRTLAGTAPAVYLPELAERLGSVGEALSDLGRPTKGLPLIEEAAAAYRRLADADPDTHLPDLARSLVNLGVRRAQSSHPAEAIAVATEAVKISRRLADADPTHLPDLATSLWQYAWVSFPFIPAEALTAVQEAIAHYELLRAASPDAYAEDFRSARRTLADVLDKLGEVKKSRRLRRQLWREDRRQGRYGDPPWAYRGDPATR
jgi:Tfp pilus assembly protein PilF